MCTEIIVLAPFSFESEYQNEKDGGEVKERKAWNLEEVECFFQGLWHVEKAWSFITGKGMDPTPGFWQIG